MKMPQSEPRYLRALVLAAGDGKARFVADEATRLDVSALASAPAPASLRGSAVLLAMKRQIDITAALIALDGVARRIVLWPHDLPRESMKAVAAAAGVQFLVAEWPPGPLEQVGAAMPADETTPRATEWVLFTSGTSGAAENGGAYAGEPGRPSVRAAPPRRGTARLVHVLRHPPLWRPADPAARADRRRLAGAVLPGSSRQAHFLARAAAAGATHFLGTPSHWRRALMTEAAGRIAPAYVRLSGEVADQGILDRLRAAAIPRASDRARLRLDRSRPGVRGGRMGARGFRRTLEGQAGGIADIRDRGGTPAGTLGAQRDRVSWPTISARIRGPERASSIPAISSSCAAAAITSPAGVTAPSMSAARKCIRKRWRR